MPKKLYKLLERGKRREQKVLSAEENVPLQWDKGWDYRDAPGQARKAKGFTWA